MSKQALFFVALTCLSISQGAGAAFRCVDDGGQVTFSDVVMANHDCTEVGLSKSGGDPGAMDALRERVKALDEESQSAQDAEQTAAAETERDALLQANCETAQTNLEVLQSGQNVVVTDESGKKAVLDAAQKEAQVAKAQKDIDYYCN